MPVVQVKQPSCVYAGEGSIGKIKDILEKEGASSVLVFTDKGIKGAGLLNLLTDELEAAGVRFSVLDDLKPEPAYTDVEAVLEQAQAAEADFIVAMGGGSVMDAAKLVSVLKGAPYTIRDLLQNPAAAKK